MLRTAALIAHGNAKMTTAAPAMKKKVSCAEVLAMKSPGLGLMLGGQPSWPTSGDQLRLCIELIG